MVEPQKMESFMAQVAESMNRLVELVAECRDSIREAAHNLRQMDEWARPLLEHMDYELKYMASP